jgi:hypothetical protein
MGAASERWQVVHRSAILVRRENFFDILSAVEDPQNLRTTIA